MKHLKYYFLSIFFITKIYSMQEFDISMDIRIFESRIGQLSDIDKKTIAKNLLEQYEEYLKKNKELRNKLKDSKEWLKLRDDIKKDKTPSDSNSVGFREGKDFMNQLDSFEKDVEIYENQISQLPKVNKQIIMRAKKLLGKLNNK